MFASHTSASTHRQHQLPVEAAGPAQAGIEAVGAVRRCDDEDVLAVGARLREAVEAREERRDHAALHAPGLRRVPPRGDRIDVVDEDDRGGVRDRVVEDHAEALLALARHAPHRLGPRHLPEIHSQLAPDGAGQARLATTRRPKEEDARGGVDAEVGVELWVGKGVLDKLTQRPQNRADAAEVAIPLPWAHTGQEDKAAVDGGESPAQYASTWATLGAAVCLWPVL